MPRVHASSGLESHERCGCRHGCRLGLGLGLTSVRLTWQFDLTQVRKYAVNVLDTASDEELSCYLLQLVQALRFERWDESTMSGLTNAVADTARLPPLAKMLVRRAAKRSGLSGCGDGSVSPCSVLTLCTNGSPARNSPRTCTGSSLWRPRIVLHMARCFLLCTLAV